MHVEPESVTDAMEGYRSFRRFFRTLVVIILLLGAAATFVIVLKITQTKHDYENTQPTN